MWPPPQTLPVTAPAKPKTKRREPSLKATKALAKAADDLSPARLEQFALFVAAKCMGLSQREAAIHAGVATRSPKQLSKKAWEMATHPYVRKLYAEAREKVARENLCTFAEQVLDVKAIAFDQCLSVQGRMQAHQLLAKMMGHEAPSKIQAEVKAGVMVIPGVTSMAEWESMARKHQLALEEAKR